MQTNAGELTGELALARALPDIPIRRPTTRGTYDSTFMATPCSRFAQLFALHLAGRRHRQRIDELDLARIFVRREPPRTCCWISSISVCEARGPAAAR
jgi:hypothetical protein